MMTLHEYLHTNEKFDQSTADKMCCDLKAQAKKYFDLDVEECIAIYRFSLLTLNYLETECNPEDFTVPSFFKLLRCETSYRNREDVDKTAYDVLIGDARDAGNGIIYVLSNFWYDVQKYLPDNADDVFFYAFKNFCITNGIAFDESAVREALTEKTGLEADELNPEKDELLTCFEYINDFLVALNGYKRVRTFEAYQTASVILEEMPVIPGVTERIREHFEGILRLYKTHGPVIEMLENQYK